MPHSYNHNSDRPGCFASAICNANNAICARCANLQQCRRSMPTPKSAVDGFQDHVIPLGGIKTGPAEYERGFAFLTVAESLVGKGKGTPPLQGRRKDIKK